MGIYVAVKYNKTSIEKLSHISKLYDIPNPTSPDDYHTTIIYSRVPGEVSLKKSLVYVTLDKFHYFDTQDGKRACVILLSKDSPMIWNEHDRMMSQDKNLTYDYDTYQPHITMSYDVPKDFQISASIDRVFLIGEEYQEALKDC